MTAITVTALLCTTILILWFRIEPLLRQRVTPTVPAPEHHEAIVRATIPADLRSVAEQESETWAQDDMLNDIVRRFMRAPGTTANERWHYVRQHFNEQDTHLT